MLMTESCTWSKSISTFSKYTQMAVFNDLYCNFVVWSIINSHWKGKQKRCFYRHFATISKKFLCACNHASTISQERVQSCVVAITQSSILLLPRSRNRQNADLWWKSMQVQMVPLHFLRYQACSAAKALVLWRLRERASRIHCFSASWLSCLRKCNKLPF